MGSGSGWYSSTVFDQNYDSTFFITKLYNIYNTQNLWSILKYLRRLQNLIFFMSFQLKNKSFIMYWKTSLSIENISLHCVNENRVENDSIYCTLRKSSFFVDEDFDCISLTSMLQFDEFFKAHLNYHWKQCVLLFVGDTFEVSFIPNHAGVTKI